MKTAILLIFAILLLGYPFAPAHATIETWDKALSGSIPFISPGISFSFDTVGWDINKEKQITGLSLGSLVSSLIPSWDAIAKWLADAAITMLKEETLEWARNGFQGGGPLFIQNPQQFLGEAANEASGAFLAELGNTVGGDPEFFCRNFGPQIIVNFADTYRGRSFKNRARCTLSDVGENFENFSARLENGDWNDFFRLREDNNNSLGMELLLFEERMTRTEIALNNAESESQWGQGYKTERECVSYESVPAGDGVGPPNRICKKWKSKTIGKQIGDRVAATIGTDFGGLFSADEISEIASQLVNLAIRQALEAGLSD